MSVRIRGRVHGAGASRAGFVGILLATVAASVPLPVRGDDWPQWRGPGRDGVWHEDGIIKKFDSPVLLHIWSAEIGSGYSGPTVADGRVYVTDRLVEPKQVERVHCFDAKSGRKVWSHVYDCPYRGVSYDAGPRASVTIDEGRAYSLGAMGNLFCFDAAKGDVIWSRDMNRDLKIEMPVWGIAASPLVVDDLVVLQIGGADGACVVALDKKTGDERWRALDDPASYSAPILTRQAGKDVVVVWTGANVAGLDPKSGKVYWKQPFPPVRMVIGIATPVRHKDFVFISDFFAGSMLVRLDPDKLKVSQVWKRCGESEQKTDSLQTIISTPYLKGDYIYGVDSYGELRCLELMTGDRVWEDLTAVPKARWATIHFIEHGDEVWMFNERGELIISKLSPAGFEEISRAKLIEPTTGQLPQRGGVCWSHPAFAYKHVFARNDKELVCASLAAE